MQSQRQDIDGACSSMSKTSQALDNLRGLVILLMVAFHCFMAYLQSQPASPAPFDRPPYDWMASPIIDNHRWIGFDLFCASQFLYLMQLMFFVSGLFVWPSLARKGARTFLHDRFLRLGVPFLIGTYLLMPLAYYPVYRIAAVDPGWSGYWQHWMALPFWPSGPMWFLWFLLALNVAAAGLYCLAPQSGAVMARLATAFAASPARFLVVVAAVSATAYLPIAAVTTPWQWVEYGPISFQPGIVPQYGIYFLAGLGLGALGLDRSLFTSDGVLARRWGLWAALALVSFLLWIIPSAVIVKGWGGALPGVPIIADIGFVLYVVCACLALAAVCLRFAAAPRPVLGSISEHAYGIYLFHYVFVIWTQYALLDLALPAIVKGVIVLAVTLVLSWAASAAMCRIPIGARMIQGHRRVSIA
jgi:glucans biosynthesis protein C